MSKILISLALVALCVAIVTAKPHKRQDHGDRMRGGQRKDSRGSRTRESRKDREDSRDRRDRVDGLQDLACSVYNATSGEQIVNKTCGCAAEVSTECSWGTLSVTGMFGEDIQVSFCDMGASEEEFPGALAFACRVENSTGDVIKEEPCKAPRDQPARSCNLATSITATVGGEQLTAFFCEHPGQPDMKRPRVSSSSDDSSSQSKSDSSSDSNSNSNSEDSVEVTDDMDTCVRLS